MCMCVRKKTLRLRTKKQANDPSSKMAPYDNGKGAGRLTGGVVVLLLFAYICLINYRYRCFLSFCAGVALVLLLLLLSGDTSGAIPI